MQRSGSSSPNNSILAWNHCFVESEAEKTKISNSTHTAHPSHVVITLPLITDVQSLILTRDMLYLLQISSPAVHLASSNHLLGKAHKKEVLIQLITPSPMRFIYRPIRIPSDNQKHLDAYIDFPYFLIFAYHLPFLVQTAKSATKVTLLWKMPDKYWTNSVRHYYFSTFESIR